MANDTPTGAAAATSRGAGVGRRRVTETKAAFKTTEFIAYVAVLAAVLIAGLVIGEEDQGRGDDFAANTVWLYATVLTFGYMVSRGIAKSGSRHRFWNDGDGPGDGR